MKKKKKKMDLERGMNSGGKEAVIFTPESTVTTSHCPPLLPAWSVFSLDAAITFITLSKMLSSPFFQRLGSPSLQKLLQSKSYLCS